MAEQDLDLSPWSLRSGPPLHLGQEERGLGVTFLPQKRDIGASFCLELALSHP